MSVLIQKVIDFFDLQKHRLSPFYPVFTVNNVFKLYLKNFHILKCAKITMCVVTS